MSLTRRIIFGPDPRRTLVRVVVLAVISFITFGWVLMPVRAEGIRVVLQTAFMYTRTHICKSNTLRSPLREVQQ